jgi:hypothetical protein
MIELYRTNDCPLCDEVEEKLSDMVLAYHVVPVDQAGPAQKLPKRVILPAIKDSGDWISGRDRIKDYLSDLEKHLQEWQKFQSDSCYVDDDGTAC